jgi:hypothetical protein
MNRMMRLAATGLALATLCAFADAQGEKKKTPFRFGFDVDEKTYPQKTPEETMGSIARAVDRQRVDYLLAQLADPLYVDYWVDRYKADVTKGRDDGKRLVAFERLTRETIGYYQDDPLIVRDLRIFAKEGKWEEKDDLAIGSADKVPARKIFLRKIGERWFLENRQQ